MSRVKRRSITGLPLRALVLALAGIVVCSLCAGAAQDPFDIDLKDLRAAPTHRTAIPHQTTIAKPAAHETAVKTGQESRYTVRSGDNLYLILIRQYGLSNTAAEQLIPEIVQRNGLHDPKRLTLGQQLIIPLAAQTHSVLDKNTEKAVPAVQTATTIAPAVGSETAPQREIVVDASTPCLLAHSVAKELDLLIPALGAMSYLNTVSIGYDGIKMDVACGLTDAETYTYDRLLHAHDIQLLVFRGVESPRQVVEELADRLGITFWLTKEDAADELPVTYIFPALYADKVGVRLTIQPFPIGTTPTSELQ